MQVSTSGRDGHVRRIRLLTRPHGRTRAICEITANTFGHRAVGYEPTVIRSGTAAVREDRYLRTLSSEDWGSKRSRRSIFYSALDYHQAYKSSKLTPIVVAEALLPLIRRDVKDATKHSIAFLDTRVDLVRKAAEESTQRYKDGKPLSMLDGVPCAVKDEEDLSGYAKCLGSRIDFTHKDDVTSYCTQR